MSWQQPLLVGNNIQSVPLHTGGKEYKVKINIQNYMNYPEEGVITDWKTAGFSIIGMTTDPDNKKAISLVIRNQYIIDPAHLEDDKEFDDYGIETRKNITIEDFEDIAEIYPAIKDKNPFVDKNGFLQSTKPPQNWLFNPTEDCIEKTLEKLSFADMTQIFVNMYERQIQIARYRPAIINCLDELKYPDTDEKIDEEDLQILREKYIIKNETLRKIFDDKGNLTLKTLIDIEGIPEAMKDYVEKHAGEIEESYLYQTMIARNEENIGKLTKLNKIYEKINT